VYHIRNLLAGPTIKGYLVTDQLSDAEVYESALNFLQGRNNGLNTVIGKGFPMPKLRVSLEDGKIKAPAYTISS